MPTDNKIAIIGDCHFGAGYNMGNIDPKTQLNTRLLDFSNTFNKIVDRFSKKNVKTIILTGDIFETRHPTSAQLSAFSTCAQRANEPGGYPATDDREPVTRGVVAHRNLIEPITGFAFSGTVAEIARAVDLLAARPHSER